MNIGQAAKTGGVSTKMIRHYESIGLLPRSRRSASGYRVFSEADVHTLRFIRQARGLGFSIEQIRELLDLWLNHGRASKQVRSIVQAHLDQIDQRIAELSQIRGTLTHLMDHCHGDDRPQCPILDRLSTGAG